VWQSRPHKTASARCCVQAKPPVCCMVQSMISEGLGTSAVLILCVHLLCPAAQQDRLPHSHALAAKGGLGGLHVAVQAPRSDCRRGSRTAAAPGCVACVAHKVRQARHGEVHSRCMGRCICSVHSEQQPAGFGLCLLGGGLCRHWPVVRSYMWHQHTTLSAAGVS
jgi:hypothetical protein